MKHQWNGPKLNMQRHTLHFPSPDNFLLWPNKHRLYSIVSYPRGNYNSQSMHKMSERMCSVTDHSFSWSGKKADKKNNVYHLQNFVPSQPINLSVQNSAGLLLCHSNCFDFILDPVPTSTPCTTSLSFSNTDS